VIYTPEITEVTIADESGDALATVRWADEASLIVQAEHMITNSHDWPDLSAAIQSAIVRMEQSVRKAQEKKA
jgi:ribosome-associated translation inhibitor RaiA